MNKEHSIRFIKVIKLLGNVLEVVGVNLFKKDYHMTWVTWFVIMVINVAIYFTFYTAYTIVRDNRGWEEVLQCLCMFGTGIQGYVKLVNIIRNHHQFRFLHDEIFEMYETSEQKHEKYRNQLQTAISLQNKLFLTILVFYTFTMLGVIAFPVYYMIFSNERLFVMPFFIPLLDPYTEFGYYCTFAFHIVCVLLASFGTLGMDCWCFLIVAHIPLHKDILRCKFDDLDELLKDYPNNSEKSKPLVRDIFQWHQKYVIFTKSAKSVYFWTIFAQIFTAFTGIVCTIVCIFLRVWPAAPVYLIYSFLNLYTFCGLGNLVEVANEDIVFMIYDSTWYLLPISEQKMVQIMLRESQNTEGMTIGDVSPLSLNTALQITKTIYSVAMMLNQFLN